MAWGGKIQSRMSEKQRRHFLRHANRRLPTPDSPFGIPKAVMKALAWEQLPFDKQLYQQRLSQLLAVYKQNLGG